MHLHRIAALAVVVLLAGCGGGDEPSVTTTPSPTSAPATTSPKAGDARSLLRALAVEEEVYLTDNNVYLAFKGTLPAAFTTTVPPGLTAGAALIGKDDYCIAVVQTGTHQGFMYTSQVGGILENAQLAKAPLVCRQLAASL